MTPEEINEAIAEWMGWKRSKNSNGWWLQSPNHPIDKCGQCGTFAPTALHLPNFYGDLNTIHEAFRRLDPHLRNDYVAFLWKITGNETSANFWTEYNFRGFYACIHATAPQRCEALLKCLNLWRTE